MTSVNCFSIPQPSQLCCLYAINCPIKTYLCFYCVPKGRSQVDAEQNHEKAQKFMHRTSNINKLILGDSDWLLGKPCSLGGH